MRNVIKTLVVGSAVLLPCSQLLAVDAELTATANFRVVLTATQTTALNFSPGADIEYSGTPGTETLTVATNNDRAETGSFFVIPNATGQAGVVTITGTSGEVVDIACDDSSVMQNAAGDQITLSAVEIHTGAGTTLAGGTDCTGTGNNVATLTLDGTDAVRVGGTIVANSLDDVTAGNYSTATATDPVVIRIVYQ
ncbi:MAG: DUF4402 domain-containing protein [Proteobacteria bacterium]|nr:DUF4402 domain-containing protein [Pseudomonadota bacterium]